MKNKITRRNLLHVLGLGAVGVGMLPISCASPKSSEEKKRTPVLRFAHITDIHLLPDDSAESGLRKCLDQILHIEQPIDFFVNGGDAIMDALGKNEEETEAQWAAWRKIMADYPDLKLYHCIGNHDVWGKTPNEETYPGKAWVSGHIHLVESLVYNGVHYHFSGAECGNWWNEEPYEQTNKGYAVFELFDDGSHTFKYVEYDL